MYNPKRFLLFQSTLLQEERPELRTTYLESFFFQSTLLQEERHLCGSRISQLLFFQSTLLQEERRCVLRKISISSTLSIHAPTRGATGTSHFPLLKLALSIHAPTRGATRINYVFSSSCNFQSTLLQEERRKNSFSCTNK